MEERESLGAAAPPRSLRLGLLRRQAFANFSRMLLRQQFANSPTVARVAPFAVFLLLTFCQGKFFAGSEYWFYLAKTLVGAWLIWEMRSFVAEMR